MGQAPDAAPFLRDFPVPALATASVLATQPRSVVANHPGLWILGLRFESARGYSAQAMALSRVDGGGTPELRASGDRSATPPP